MAVMIKFDLRRNSGDVRRFYALSCSVTSPTTSVKLSSFFKTVMIRINARDFLKLHKNSCALILHSQNESDTLPLL